ncbi:hypothetical protein [Pseudarthrobacter sp. TAF60_1]
MVDLLAFTVMVGRNLPLLPTGLQFGVIADEGVASERVLAVNPDRAEQ